MVPELNGARRILRFGAFEVDLREQELRKHGLRVKLPNQPFQVLAALLEKPGELVSRDEIYQQLWPDQAFGDFEHNLNAVVKKLRVALGDSAETPRFIDTVARRGYRFIAPVVPEEPIAGLVVPPPPVILPAPKRRSLARKIALRVLWSAGLVVSLLLVTTIGAVVYSRRYPPPPRPQRSITRLASGTGLQFGVTWSPERRFVAYSSDRDGKFDIWVEQAQRVNPIKITSLPGHNWQPDWSPHGDRIVFRSEGEEGGLFVVPALGGAPKKIADFGYRPRWSPEGGQVLFTSTAARHFWNKLYLVGLDGKPPREILAEFFNSSGVTWRTAAWRPAGGEISVWGTRPGGGCGFWTVPISGERAVESKIGFDFVQAARGLDLDCLGVDGDFVWAPSGRAIYFSAGSRGVRNLWRIAVNPSTLEWKSLERLTTGPGPDTDLGLSPDGKDLAFTVRTQQKRIWLFPFDPIKGSLKGKGRPVTPAGEEVVGPDISPDGTGLVYTAWRDGKFELREQWLDGARQAVLVDNGPERFGPRWSPDGKRILYSSRHGDCRSMPAGGGSEQILSEDGFCWDWSPDGQSVVLTTANLPSLESAIRLTPVSRENARVVATGRDKSFFQTRVSPNGKWVVFEVLSRAASAETRLYTVSAAGGEWVPIPDGNSAAGQPRWAPDGKAIFFTSVRQGFSNVWAVRFDPVSGRPLGEPFRITAFDSPATTMSDISVAANRLVLLVTQSSGNTWVIENPEL